MRPYSPSTFCIFIFHTNSSFFMCCHPSFHPGNISYFSFIHLHIPDYCMIHYQIFFISITIRDLATLPPPPPVPQLAKLNTVYICGVCNIDKARTTAALPFAHEGNTEEENDGYTSSLNEKSTDQLGLMWSRGGEGRGDPARPPFHSRLLDRYLETT